MFPHINNVFELQQDEKFKVTQYGCLLKGNFWGVIMVRLTCKVPLSLQICPLILLFIFNLIYLLCDSGKFCKSYLFVECTSRDGERQNKDTKRYTLHTPTMTPSSLVQCLYEYSNLSSFEVTSKESFLSTVNNGKALSMTILYAYMYGLFLKRRSSSLRCGSPHDTRK